MGWDFTPGASRADIIKYITTQPRCLKWKLSGNVLWSLWDGEWEQQWIGCSLLQNGGRDGWGKKDMEESMGPFQYDCPLEYLEQAPVQNEAWRAKVREYWAKQPVKATKSKRMPTHEQIGALNDWKNKHGRTWRADLDAAWMKAGEGVPGYNPLLHQLRIEFGPSWLASVKMKDLFDYLEQTT